MKNLFAFVTYYSVLWIFEYLVTENLRETVYRFTATAGLYYSLRGLVLIGLIMFGIESVKVSCFNSKGDLYQTTSVLVSKIRKVVHFFVSSFLLIIAIQL